MKDEWRDVMLLLLAIFEIWFALVINDTLSHFGFGYKWFYFQVTYSFSFFFSTFSKWKGNLWEVTCTAIKTKRRLSFDIFDYHLTSLLCKATGVFSNALHIVSIHSQHPNKDARSHKLMITRKLRLYNVHPLEWLTLTPSYFCTRLWCLCKSIFICIFLVCTQKRSYIHLPSSSFFTLPQSLISFQSTVTTVQLDIWTILSCFTKVISHLSINLAVQGGTLSLQQICTIADVICSRFKLASTFSL